jgi:hypothetical protein
MNDAALGGTFIKSMGGGESAPRVSSGTAARTAQTPVSDMRLLFIE